MPTNEDVLRSFYAAFRQDDIEGALVALAADVTWTRPEQTGSGGGSRTASGREQVRAALTAARTEFGELRPEPREFIASGTRVVVLGDYRPRDARPGGGTVPFAHTWDLPHGRATRFEDVHDPAEIRRILGGDDDSTGALDRILQLGLGFWRSGTVLAAVRLGVFTALAGAEPGLPQRELGLAELAARTGVHDRGARDFFDALVALDLLRRENGKYRNSPHAAEHLDAGKPDTYIGGLLAEAGEQWYPAWAHLSEALADGTPRWVVPGDANNPYEQIYAAPERFRNFQRAMIGGAMTAMLALPRKFPGTATGP